MWRTLKRVWHTGCEYVTHWMVAGAILAGTGVTPDHWLAHLFERLHLPASALHLWAFNLDLRVVLAALGLLLIGADIGWRYLRTPAALVTGRDAGAMKNEDRTLKGEVMAPPDAALFERVAVVHADVAGYGHLTQVDELGTQRQLSACLHLMGERIRNSGGVVVRFAGNAVVARFQSAVAAIHCAISIQDALMVLCAEVEKDRRLHYRIGVDLGRVAIDNNDIHGEAVSVAAQLSCLAEPGGIWLSESVFQQIQDKPDARFQDIGDQKLPTVALPIRTYRYASAPEGPDRDGDSMDRIDRMSRVFRIAGPASIEAAIDVFEHAGPPSIMILPFRNLGGNTNHDALVDGLRLAIQSSLVKLPGLFLVNASAAEQYRLKSLPAVKVGSEVGIRYVLEGAVQIADDRLRVTVQLTDAPAAQIIWSERYDRVIDDIFSIQDEITTEVAVALDVKLIAGEGALVWWANLPSRAARELALRGLSHMYMGTEVGNIAARKYFDELMALVSDSPQAPALAAYTRWQSVMRGWSDDPAKHLEQATALAEKAIERGDPDGFGRITLASVRLLEGRHDEALALSESAEVIRASCPVAKAVYSSVLHFCGQHVRAIDIIKRAVKHARVYPSWMASILAASYRDNGQVAESIAVAQECLRIDAENLDGYVLLCTDHILTGSTRGAREVALEMLRRHPRFTISAYLETQPYKDAKTLESVARALREAGLPE